MGSKIRLDKFYLIREKYNEFYNEFYSKGRNTVLDTKKGIWGPSDTQNIYDFFIKAGLDRYNDFIDLGSGDGKVVLIASLFGINAVGVEADKKLIDVGVKIRDELGLNCEFICDDFLNHELSKYDFVFINPDKGFENFEEKLLREMDSSAKLFVYNKLFLPRFLKRGKSYWFDGIPVICYRKK